jgi:hypothetical protein
LNLSGEGDIIEAQRLILSLFYSIKVGPGSILRGPLVNGSSGDVAPKLNCDDDICPVEIIHPPEDCNLNSSLSFTLQVCRVEDIDIWGLVQGTVIHFNRARSVSVHTSGTISATGLGNFCTFLLFTILYHWLVPCTSGSMLQKFVELLGF